MRKVLSPVIQFIYLEEPESEERLKNAYARIFEIARRNLATSVVLVEHRIPEHNKIAIDKTEFIEP